MTEEEALARIAALPRLHGDAKPAHVRTLLAALGDPQKGLRYIHVAGTNGKGSICTMTDAILRAAGYRVGLYTSPYINFFRERFRMDGAPADVPAFTAAAGQVFDALNGLPDLPLSQFDVITAIGFCLFHAAGCDFVVLECGLGGRLDATNVIDAPCVAVIGNIGFDHTELLGNTPAAIAAEKCGIIKPGGGAVVLAPQDYPEAEETVRTVAKERNVPLYAVDTAALTVEETHLDYLLFSYRGVRYRSSLAARYQAQNAATAIEISAALRHTGTPLSEKAVHAGLACAYIPARFERLACRPSVLLDGAHNADGLRALHAALLSTRKEYRRLFCLVGMLRDKAPGNALAAFFDGALPVAAVAAVTPPSPRACPAAELADTLRALPGLTAPVTAYDDIRAALLSLCRAAGPEDAVVCFGSLYQMGLIRALLSEIRSEGLPHDV